MHLRISAAYKFRPGELGNKNQLEPLTSQYLERDPLREQPTVRYMCSTGLTPSFFPTSPFFFVLDLEDGRCVRFERHGSGYLLELRLTTTGKFRFGATPYSTIIIGVWGSRQRKIKAAYQFFLYTLLGSVFMLLAILLILFQTGTADLQISLTTEFSERRQIFLWIASFAAFAVKVPMVPVHIWLPEAHVEAPTAGSVILAGIPSKLGTHGFLRFSIPMFPEATLCSTPFIYTPSAIAIIYTSLTTSRQIDLKKIIAYSSVAHMNLVTIGMFSRAAAVRSPIFSYGHTRQGQNMRQQNIAVCSKNKSPLAPRDGGGGHPTRRQQQHRLYESAQALGQLSSLIHRSNALGSSHGWREKPKCSCVVVVRRLDAFPSLPGIVPHRKKERRAPARPVV
ncbi:hypothetical protein VNO77_50915 [Canavalia gladiata]|uniref:NADH-ubiquinone oxidoreductase chain 4 n=1 Tax=Canavalia gladiata TaxID=3824 RepID=A0AAN9JBP0_CANGL